jgi:hypothetical protein
VGALGLRVEGLGLRVLGFGFGFLRLEVRVLGLG